MSRQTDDTPNLGHCADCKIDLRRTVWVCHQPQCRDKHEQGGGCSMGVSPPVTTDDTPNEGRTLTAQCWRCKGSGQRSRLETLGSPGNHPCPRCNGTGTIELEYAAPASGAPHAASGDSGLAGDGRITPPPTAAPEPPQPYVYMCPRLCGCLWSDNHDGTMSLFGVKSQSCNVCEYLPLDKLIPLYKAALPRPHRIGVWDYQSLCDCLKHNLEQAIPNYPYRDPQDAIQTLAARVMTLQRKEDVWMEQKAKEEDGAFVAAGRLELDASTAKGPREGLKTVLPEGLIESANESSKWHEAHPTIPEIRERAETAVELQHPDGNDYWRIRYVMGNKSSMRLVGQEHNNAELCWKQIAGAMAHFASEEVAAALERAAQIAREHHQGDCAGCVAEVIAIEILKLAEEIR